MSAFVQQCMQYARFLRADKGVPEALGIWVGGFMLMSRSRPFYTATEVWAPRGTPEMIRVYFEPWSQNRLPALRNLDGNYYFSASDRDVYVRTKGLPTLRPFNRDWDSAAFSGAQTRSSFYDAKEGMQWLKDQLAVMY